MRWALLAGAIGFSLVELASLSPVGTVASVDVRPTLHGKPNEAAIAWALSTRDPYLDVATVRGFRDVVLRGDGPDADALAAYLRERTWVTRHGDSVVLSVRGADPVLVTKAAEFFGSRLQYFTKRPHAGMSAPRVEWLSLRGYELRRALGLPLHADASAPPRALTTEERARIESGDAAARQELLAVDEELRFWTAPVRDGAAMDSSASSVTLRARRRFGTWPAHIVSFGVAVALSAMALLIRAILRGGARASTAALALVAATTPLVAGTIAGALSFRARSTVRIDTHRAPGDEALASAFVRSPERFLDAEHFPDLWPAEAVASSAGAPPELRRFTLPEAVTVRATAAGLEIAVVERDALEAMQKATILAQRIGTALQSVGGLARFRERASLPQMIRLARGRIQWHDAALAAPSISPELAKIHRDKRVEDETLIASLEKRITQIDAAPMPFDLVAVDDRPSLDPVLFHAGFHAKRRVAIVAAVALGLLLLLVFLARDRPPALAKQGGT